MKIIVQEEWYNEKQCIENPMSIYVFGDNVQRVGNGGQAQIRHRTNSIGVATKRAPLMDDKAFYNDSFGDLKSLINDIDQLYSIHNSNTYDHMNLIFPKDGLGTGLSELPKRAPMINKMLSMMLEQYFGITTNDDGTLCLKD